MSDKFLLCIIIILLVFCFLFFAYKFSIKCAEKFTSPSAPQIIQICDLKTGLYLTYQPQNYNVYFRQYNINNPNQYWFYSDGKIMQPETQMCLTVIGKDNLVIPNYCGTSTLQKFYIKDGRLCIKNKNKEYCCYTSFPQPFGYSVLMTRDISQKDSCDLYEMVKISPFLYATVRDNYLY